MTEEAAPHERYGDFGVLRQWPKAKVAKVVGTAEPTSADLDAFDIVTLFDADPSLTRWNGRCIVLYKHGRPDEPLIWGWSGD